MSAPPATLVLFLPRGPPAGPRWRGDAARSCEREDPTHDGPVPRGHRRRGLAGAHALAVADRRAAPARRTPAARRRDHRRRGHDQRLGPPPRHRRPRPAAPDRVDEPRHPPRGRRASARHTLAGGVAAFTAIATAAASIQVPIAGHVYTPGQGVIAAFLAAVAAKALRLLPNRGWRAAWALGILVAVSATVLSDGLWWIPASVAVGVSVHILGDALTNNGVALLWPLSPEPPRACGGGSPPDGSGSPCSAGPGPGGSGRSSRWSLRSPWCGPCGSSRSPLGGGGTVLSGGTRPPPPPHASGSHPARTVASVPRGNLGRPPAARSRQASVSASNGHPGTRPSPSAVPSSRQCTCQSRRRSP